MHGKETSNISNDDYKLVLTDVPKTSCRSQIENKFAAYMTLNMSHHHHKSMIAS